MKTRFKRLLAAVLSLIMVLSLAACSAPAGSDQTKEADKTTEALKGNDSTEGKEETSEAPTGAAEFDPRSVTEGVTLTVAVPMEITVMDWETNAVTLAIQEALGVELEFEVYGSADYTDKLNVMVNGGDKLPDIIMGYSGSGTVNIDNSVDEWANAGALTDLTEYFQNPDYAKYTYLGMERENDQFLNRCKDANGKIWGFSTYVSSPNDQVPYNLLINAEFAKAVGFDELPTTTEGFLELARAFKAAGDVNGNGKDDEVVLTGRGDNLRWFICLMSAFEYAWGDNYLVDNNGELHFAYTTDAWKEGLKYIKTFFDEGLIDTGALTNDKTAYNSIIESQDPRVLADVYYWCFVSGDDEVEKYTNMLMYDKPVALSSPVKAEAEGHYDPVDPITTAAISADCENPLAAFIVLDYMYSEAISITNRYGEEGVNWDYWVNVDESLLPEGKTKEMYAARVSAEYAEPYIIAYNRMWGGTEAQNVMYNGIGPGIVGSSVYNGEAILVVAETELDQAKMDYQKKNAQAIADCLEIIPEVVVTEASLAMTADELDAMTDIKSTLKKYVQESIASFLTGQWDIDSYWDTYLSELDKIGADDALELYQTAYDRATK